MSRTDVNLLFAGDYHVYGAFDEFITHHPDHAVFSPDLIQAVREADLSIFNLEDPVTPERTNGCLKAGPHGVGSEASLPPVARAGFQLATFATNHTFDMKDRGIADTLDACARNGLAVVGAGLTAEQARRPFTRTINGRTIAILNFARHEFNLATGRHGGANPLDVVDNAQDILRAKESADYVFVVVHEGVDAFALPYPGLIKQMRFYADLGADAVVLHHARRISGFEIHRGKPIFYGLGNLLHMSANREEHKGMLARFSIDAQGLRSEMIPVQFQPGKMQVALAEGAEQEAIVRQVTECSTIIQDDLQLAAAWSRFTAARKDLYLATLAGHPRMVVRFARKLGLLPVYERWLRLKKRRFLEQKSLFTCQAHREAVITILDEIFKE